jgi:hypothetical protein
VKGEEEKFSRSPSIPLAKGEEEKLSPLYKGGWGDLNLET